MPTGPDSSTDPLGRKVLIVNPRSGGGKAPRAGIAERAREQGVDVIELGPDQDLAEAVDQALAGGATALGMAGGDGSMATVASAALSRGLPFICIPTGTRNHFALDLGLDTDAPAGALKAFEDGVETPIDVGEVNGHMFLNCVSLGVYGEAVRKSEYREEKTRTLLETAHAVLGPSGEAPQLQLVDDQGTEHHDPAIVLVSNNPYELAPPTERRGRRALHGGALGIIVIDRPAVEKPPSARAWSATSVAVGGPATVHAGIDGEAVDLDPPLEFVIRPGALKVRLPSRVAAAIGAARGGGD